MSRLLADWMLTYLLHSTLLLGIAWLATRFVSERQLQLRETLWRVALFGGLVTASLQLGFGIEPFAGSWSVASGDATETPLTHSEPLAPTLIGPADSLPVPPATSSRTTPLAIESIEWNRWLARGWGAIGLPLLLLLALSYVRFRWRLRDRTDLVDGDLPRFLRSLVRRTAGERGPTSEVRLTRSARVSVPLARGMRRGEICLPPETLERLPIERQEIVVAHELAHLRRRDPLWFGLARVIERGLFFQPLNALARRSLQEISEFRCDDWAVSVTRRPISLAKCLTEVAEWSLRTRTSIPVPTMSVSKTQLSRRVSRLLKRSYPMPSERMPRWLVPAAVSLLALTVLIAPSISAHTSEEPSTEPNLAPLVVPTAPAAPIEPIAPPPPAPPTPDLPILPEIAVGDLNQLVSEYGELVAHLNVQIEEGLLPVIAGVAVEIDPAVVAEQAALAAHVARSWAFDLEFDQEQVARLQAMAERLEEVGYATEAETERLAELAEQLVESAEPLIEHREKLEARARAMAESHRRIAEEHRERMQRLHESESEELRQAREVIRQSLEERRELLERARREHEETLEQFDREHRERLRQEMLRSREQLREQLRRLDEELERQEREGQGRH